MFTIRFHSYLECFIKNIDWQDLPYVRPWQHTQNVKELDPNFYQRH